MNAELDSDLLKTWVINLDRAPDRWRRVGVQWLRLGLPWTRPPAVDADAPRTEPKAALDTPGCRLEHGMELLACGSGCYLSLVEAMRAFLVPTARFALVLRGDVILTPSACGR